MFDGDRFEKFAVVIDDENARQATDLRLIFRKVTAVELELDVSAEVMDAGRHLI